VDDKGKLEIIDDESQNDLKETKYLDQNHKYFILIKKNTAVKSQKSSSTCDQENKTPGTFNQDS
jgi:hypothetical protein